MRWNFIEQKKKILEIGFFFILNNIFFSKTFFKIEHEDQLIRLKASFVISACGSTFKNQKVKFKKYFFIRFKIFFRRSKTLWVSWHLHHGDYPSSITRRWVTSYIWWSKTGRISFSIFFSDKSGRGFLWRRLCWVREHDSRKC